MATKKHWRFDMKMIIIPPQENAAANIIDIDDGTIICFEGSTLQIELTDEGLVVSVEHELINEPLLDDTEIDEIRRWGGKWARMSEEKKPWPEQGKEEGSGADISKIKTEFKKATEYSHER